MNAHQHSWLAIPWLPCISIEETLSFYEHLGYAITYKQTRPYQYGIVERNGAALHFGRVKGVEAAGNYNSSLVIIPDAAKVYEDFSQRLRNAYGKIAHSGIPRISRMKPDTTRFTLTDVAGNSIIYISRGGKDQDDWEQDGEGHQSPLQKAIGAALRFRDYKNDDRAAAATLDAALKRMETESPLRVAEALIMRIDLAEFMNDRQRADECRHLLGQLKVTAKEIKALQEKHQQT